MTAVTVLCQTLTSPTHANVLLAAPGKFLSVQLGNSFLSSEPSVHWSRLALEVFPNQNLKCMILRNKMRCHLYHKAAVDSNTAITSLMWKWLLKGPVAHVFCFLLCLKMSDQCTVSVLLRIKGIQIVLNLICAFIIFLYLKHIQGIIVFTGQFWRDQQSSICFYVLFMTG